MTDNKKKENVDSADNCIWGINAVVEALSQEKQGINEILIQKGKGGSRIQQIVDTAREKQIKLRFADGARMGVAKSVNHQGVVARLAAVPLKSFDELLQCLVLDPGGAPRILVLDSIQDPRNVGSILRSALAAGFEHILLTRERSAPITGTVAKTSAGALAHLNLYQAVNLSDALQQLKANGAWVYGTVVEGEDVSSIYSTDFSGAVCLVIGNEEKGIRPLVKKQCDHLVTIPMAGSFNSLNVSAAAAVIMFEIRRQLLA